MHLQKLHLPDIVTCLTRQLTQTSEHYAAKNEVLSKVEITTNTSKTVLQPFVRDCFVAAPKKGTNLSQ